MTTIINPTEVEFDLAAGPDVTVHWLREGEWIIREGYHFKGTQKRKPS